MKDDTAPLTGRTRRLPAPWPFLYSVTPRGLVRNLPPKSKKQARLKKLPPASKWVQEMLL